LNQILICFKTENQLSISVIFNHILNETLLDKIVLTGNPLTFVFHNLNNVFKKPAKYGIKAIIYIGLRSSMVGKTRQDGGDRGASLDSPELLQLRS